MGEPRLLSNDELWAIQRTAASVNATTQDILHTALMLGNQIADLRAKLEQAEATSESRRATLLEVREQQREDWKRAEQAEARVRRLVEALKKYGRHFETCPGSHPAYCECGLTATLNPPSLGETK